MQSHDSRLGERQPDGGAPTLDDPEGRRLTAELGDRSLLRNPTSTRSATGDWETEAESPGWKSAAPRTALARTGPAGVEHPEEDNARALRDWPQRTGQDTCTGRKAQRGARRLKTIEDTRRAIAVLVDRGVWWPAGDAPATGFCAHRHPDGHAHQRDGSLRCPFCREGFTHPDGISCRAGTTS